VTTGSSRSFQSAESAQADPLAHSLFDVGDVVSVFYMDRFITVNKEDDVSWEDLLKRLAEPIRSAPAVSDAPRPGAGDADGLNGLAGGPGYVPGADPVLDRINQVLDEKVRPGLAGDGGGLEIVGYHDHRLMIHYQGACGSCPSSVSGTLYAIENMLREEVDPEIEVISV